jgi:hypothetical protein
LLPSPLFLVQLAPTDRRLKVGQRVQWPGEDQVWMWNGSEWVAERVDGFDGGDLWEAEEERPAA